MRRSVMLIAGAAAVVVLAGAAAGAAGARSGGGDDQQPIAGGALARASAAALRQTGGFRVTDSEIHDEEGFYEVEVTRADGSQVDVHLDQRFHVLDVKPDGGGADEGTAGR
jgi:uncharacterized membrane protein YkoI